MEPSPQRVASPPLAEKPKVSLEPKVNDKRGLSQAHAIRIFKLVQTNADSIIDSIQQYYPDWEKIVFANSQRKYTKVIVRQKNKTNIHKATGNTIPPRRWTRGG